MDRLHKALVLLLVAGIPAAAPPFSASSPSLCFTEGSVTYQLLPSAASADYRVKIDNAAPAPQLRIGLVDAVEVSDFALVDDDSTLDRNGCDTAGRLKTFNVVANGPADLTVRLTREAADTDLKLFVRSARLDHREAAALFAVLQYNQPKISNGNHADSENRTAERIR
jgi:hypothetical protein